MRIFITGYSGRIGKRLVDAGCLPLYCDITDYKETNRAISDAQPEVVVNLASISSVDYCEKKENTNAVMAVNFTGAINVADACKKNKCGMVFLSTDHVFNGKRGPYKEDYKYWLPNWLGQHERPVNYYGLIKVAAENYLWDNENVKIVRTSYLFDGLRLMTLNETYYPTFLYRSFMHVDNFAKALYEYLKKYYEMPKVLHIAGSKTISWYEFAKFQFSGRKILPRKHEIKDQFAPRPHRAGLDVSLSDRFGIPQFSYSDPI